MIKLPIICNGGIGDCILVLSRVPIRLLGLFGIRFQIYYVFETEGEDLAPKTLDAFFRSIRYAEYIEGTPPSPRQQIIYKKMSSLLHRLRILWKVPLVGSKVATPRTRSQRARILIQTHLDGHHGCKEATAKIWAIENWIELIRELEKRGHSVSIMEWDVTGRERIQAQCPGLPDISKGNFIELCDRVAQFDLLISIDSWTKYVAEWYGVKQIVIVPNLSRGYTEGFKHISARYVARWWFQGLLDNPRVTVIGLRKTNGTYEYSLNSLGELQVEELIQITQSKLQEFLSFQPSGPMTG